MPGRLGALVKLVLIVLVIAIAPPTFAAQDVETLRKDLATTTDFRVRVSAALALGKKKDVGSLDVISKALGDETRWRIVRELLKGTRTVGELTERLDVSQYNVSKHVRVLREADIVETEKEGKHVRCSVASAFRKRLKHNELDLGCCTFRFD